jgi:dipeptidase D
MKPESYPLEPAHLWEHFYQISCVPRPSGSEAALRDKLITLAAERDCKWATDQRGNLVIYVPGTHGMERSAPVVIQNHLDMVTVKTDDCEHDFSRDPISLELEAGWLGADRTTLGADNGLGCAAALALMTDAHVVHPPLELLFTVEEETGLYGAAEFDASLLTGTRMLNLDTEDWGELFIGCAGGRGWILRKSLPREPAAGHAGEETAAFRLNLRGLAGGHSGIQIHQQLGNAIKLLGEWLHEAETLGVKVFAFDGGVAHNVIPREACVSFLADPSRLQALEDLNRELLLRWRAYLPEPDQKLSLEIVPTEPGEPLTLSSQSELRQLLALFPHGAQSYNLEQPADLVDLSINLAVLRLDADGLFLESTLRYFNASQADTLARQVLAIAELFSCQVEDTVDYPGWEPDFNNPLLQQTVDLYRELFQQTPQVKAIHAGLECGILKSKKPELDIVSFGPTIRGAHSPGERVEVATVTPFWELLTGLLQRL